MISYKKINLLEEIISYNFKDKQLLKSALVHPSYVAENKKKINVQKNVIMYGIVLKV